ncbi:MAG TPA: SUMF1/EgtB/PvdO family nonheme iron enzyme [Bryobacteraceae bacterium]
MKLILTLLLAATLAVAQQTNSIGMQLVRIQPGEFTMGASETPLPKELAPKPYLQFGDFDEKPAHRVRITHAFLAGATEVTNAQYEQFDPAHRQLRGKLGFSRADDEAVVFVSWNDAVRFTAWLSKKEGRPYRLSTEAEWEYFARAGTTTPFHTGETLPSEFRKNVKISWFPDPAREKGDQTVVLNVGKTPPNPWGLYDVHGNVEEWCLDWYGPYNPEEQTDPVGRAAGDFRVTRGGSHSTELYYLRSANRSGALPDDCSWLIGFRVVQGPAPATHPIQPVPPERYQLNVSQKAPAGVHRGPDPSKPYFKGPREYVKIPPNSYGPLFSQHNHDPAITECPNGDLLAIWYSCVTEPGRELATAASRLRYGQEEWEPASLFWDAPDRNDHAPALWFDGQKTIYHFQGMAAAATWGALALIMRTSTDNGVTWSPARLIEPEHGLRHQPVESVFRTREGFIIVPADAITGGNGGTSIHISRDNGKTWSDPGGDIRGIHGGVTQLKDGRLMAFGRGLPIDGHMPKSLSTDMGRTWSYGASPFPPIGGGQRLVLMRLREGPIFLASFGPDGLFATVSDDEGETWPIRRLVTDDAPAHQVMGIDNHPFTMSPTHAEPNGYLSVCQGLDGVIHLISSRQHYAFNLAWIRAAAR